MLNWRYRLLLGLVGMISVLVVSSCADKSAGRLGTDSPLPVPSSTSPLPTTVSPVAIDEPLQALSPEDVPDPDKGKGTVIGTIYDVSLDEPYANQFIYLAKVIELKSDNADDSPMFFVELDVQSDPFDQTDQYGRLVIENVEPGLYALAVRLPNLQETLLYDAETNTTVSVEIEPDEISDMGRVRIQGPR